MRDDSDPETSWLPADRNTVRRQDVSDLAIYELGYTMGVSYDFMTGGECEACGNAVSESCIGESNNALRYYAPLILFHTSPVEGNTA